MAGVGGFRGVSAEQDIRYINKEKKAMANMKFPKELDAKVSALPLALQLLLLAAHACVKGLDAFSNACSACMKR